ncbi:MAG: hypothetical protein KA366_03235 [Hydromonas sp.]|nr:hypothetical protein [Hydromonas sp.]
MTWRDLVALALSKADILREFVPCRGVCVWMERYRAGLAAQWFAKPVDLFC